MHLVIQAHTLKNEPLSQPITGRFDDRGGTIGRSDTNTLALPDPERHISRLQAEVWSSNGSFSIRNVGSANSIVVNGRPIRPGEGATLADADEIVIGSYVMRATLGTSAMGPAASAREPIDGRTVIASSASESRTHPPAARTGPPPAGPTVQPDPVTRLGATVQPPAPAADPFAGLLGSGSATASADPFADLLGPASAPGPAAAPAAARAPEPPPARLPDDFDPFASFPTGPRQSTVMGAFMDGRSPALPPVPGPLPSDLGLGDLLGTPASAPSSGLDTMFGLDKPAAVGFDPLAAFFAPAQPGNAAAAPAESKDPLAMFGGPAAAETAPAIPADFNHTPELQAAYVPPAVQQRPPEPARPPLPFPPEPGTRVAPADDLTHATTRPAVRVARPAAEAPVPASVPAPAPSPGDASNDALWEAFCEGAGIGMKLPQGLNPDLMRVIGQVLQHSIDGTLKLVAVRAAAKQELRADVTMIQARHNNPLKFSPDAPAAIAQLLQPPMRGFMVGPAAVHEVMDDLLGHAIGTMSGMRAALAGVLQRFEPSQLESKLVGSSMLDTLLPMNRRAKLWELYLQHYERIQGDAQDDFHDLFGKAFVAAYEEQLDRLDASRRKPA